jgi:hypothetical protein
MDRNIPPSLVARTLVLVVAGTLALWSTPASAQAPTERMTDTEVRTLIEKVDTGRDKFEGNLDGDFKGSTLRDANKEVLVSAALQDYQDNVKKLKERFTPDYSASAEVVTVLKQAEGFDKFIQATPRLSKGRSEWEHQVADLKRLATAYNTTFPIKEGANARRINDKETAGFAADVAGMANRVKDDFNKVPVTALPKPAKDTIKTELELLNKQANATRSRVGDHKPATVEARQVVTQAAVVQKFIDAHPTPTAAENWKMLQAALASLQQAFNFTN